MQPITMLIIIMAVNIFALPIYVVVAYLINSVLMAPTVEDVKEQLDYARARRNSVTQLAITLNQKGVTTTQQQDQQQHQRQQQQLEKHPRSMLFTSFSTVDEDVLKTQRAMRGIICQATLLDNNTAALSRENHFDSFENLVSDIGNKSCWLVGRNKKEFTDNWPIYSALPKAAMQKELEEVMKVSDEWKEKLRRLPPAAAGIRLLQLFAQDLIGRQSRQAQLLANHLEAQQLEDKLVMSLGAKALALSTIVILNIAFIYTCMLYGRINGM